MGIEMCLPAQKSGTTLTLTPEEPRRRREPVPDPNTNQLETIDAAVNRCAVIVGANAHQYAALSIAERRGIGCVTAVQAPVAIPSPDLAPPPGARPAGRLCCSPPARVRHGRPDGEQCAGAGTFAAFARTRPNGRPRPTRGSSSRRAAPRTRCGYHGRGPARSGPRARRPACEATPPHPFPR
jgi:hypothetical protein